MAPIREIVYYASDPSDAELLEGVSRRLGLPTRSDPMCGAFGLLGRLPSRWRRGPLAYLAYLVSPWLDAVHLARATGPDQLVIIKNLMSARLYLCLPSFRPSGRRKVVISWFTMSAPPGRLGRRLYRRAVRRASAVFTYSPDEPRLYAEAFGVPEELFSMVDLQFEPMGGLDDEPEPIEPGFDAIMTGSSGRDWPTFLEVCRALPGLRFAAIAPRDQIERMGEAPNLTKFEGMPRDRYLRMMCSCKVNLLLLRDQFGASGQRDLLFLGRLGRPLVATGIEAITYYAGDAARYVAEGDAAGVASAVEELVGRPGLRDRMGRTLRDHLRERCAPDAVAGRWASLLGNLIGGDAEPVATGGTRAEGQT